jgi:hypothetical protein
MMKDDTETFCNSTWHRLECVLQELGVKLLAGREDYICQIGKYSNNTFPLRAYLSILKSKDGDELAITIDAKQVTNGLLIEADVIGENGVIIAEGPSLELLGNISDLSIQLKIDEWFDAFEQFLVESNKEIEAAIMSLAG